MIDGSPLTHVASPVLGILQPVLHPYDWGSISAIPAFLGIPETGGPVAEAWYGAHPSAPSPLLGGGQPVLLSDVIGEDPDATLGAAVAERFGATLPYLVKVLAAARPLSIQAHPSAAQAAAGFARENEAGVPLDAPVRTYRDPHAKPEMIVALEPFELLYGLREPTASAALLAELEVPSLADIAERLRPGDPSALRDVAVTLTELTVAERATAIAELVAACEASPPSTAPAIGRWIAQLGREHPDDLGVLFAFLMNHHVLQPFEACFLPARTLHAYLHGTGIEIMGNSDNVIRAGLTSKAVAVDELLAVVDYTPSLPATRAAPSDGDLGGWSYPVPADEFAAEMLTFDGAGGEMAIEVAGPEILVTVDGGVVVDAAPVPSRTLARGDVLFVGADTGRYWLDGTGRIIRVSVGLPRPDSPDGAGPR